MQSAPCSMFASPPKTIQEQSFPTKSIIVKKKKIHYLDYYFVKYWKDIKNILLTFSCTTLRLADN